MQNPSKMRIRTYNKSLSATCFSNLNEGMSLRRREPPRTMAPAEPELNREPQSFHEEIDEPWIRYFNPIYLNPHFSKKQSTRVRNLRAINSSKKLEVQSDAKSPVLNKSRNHKGHSLKLQFNCSQASSPYSSKKLENNPC